MLASCNLCAIYEKPATFSVPWDEIGKELMAAHLEEHERKGEK